MSAALQVDNRRFLLIDAIKALAAQLIVLHHLAWYGPMTDVAAGLSPYLDLGIAWLAEHGRYAVAAFLAVGGFLAAQGLPPGGLPAGKSPLCLIFQRYVRLVGPYAVALILVMASAAIARRWMAHDSIGAPPSMEQFIAHLFLLHDILDFEALSAGVWYVAIDFQLYVVLILLLWLAGRLFRRPAGADFGGPLLVAACALASLFFFNLHPDWDDTALYFFGAYAFGVGSAWSVDSTRPYRGLFLLLLVGAIALGIDFRPRLAVALAVALLLGIGRLHFKVRGNRLLTHFGNASYALFLVHFPVCLLVNAAFHRLAPENPLLNVMGIALAWGLSNVAAFLFHHGVERRLQARLAGRGGCPRVQPA